MLHRTGLCSQQSTWKQGDLWAWVMRSGFPSRFRSLSAGSQLPRSEDPQAALGRHPGGQQQTPPAHSRPQPAGRGSVSAWRLRVTRTSGSRRPRARAAGQAARKPCPTDHTCFKPFPSGLSVPRAKAAPHFASRAGCSARALNNRASGHRLQEGPFWPPGRELHHWPRTEAPAAAKGPRLRPNLCHDKPLRAYRSTDVGSTSQCGT